MSPSEKRDPIKQSPQRLPGQSLAEEMDLHLNEHLLPWISVGACAVVFSGLEWIRWGFELPYQPLVISLASLVLVGFVGRKYWIARKRL